MPRDRVTIVDVARRAGVAKSTVSVALNNQPGVSDDVRERVRRVAVELGWRPSSVARALSKDRAGVCGMILARDPRSISVEPFFTRLTSGIESELSRNGIALMVQYVPGVDAEIEAYRTWWSERRVDGVIMVDCRVADPRLRLGDHVGVPAVMLSHADDDTTVPCLDSGDGAAMWTAVEHLHALDHRRIGWCSGPDQFAHTIERRAVFQQACADLGIVGHIAHSDYTTRSGATACRSLMAQDPRPTALIFDNDVMALAGLGTLAAAGVSVPSEVSVVSWEDSVLCTAAYPNLTSLHRDVFGYGVAGARALLDVIEGRAARPRAAATQRLVVRASTSRWTT